METRKVQRLGPTTVAMTLPADWAREQGVEKGDEVSLQTGGKGTLTVLPDSAGSEETEAIIHADNLEARALERAVIAQYVLGRRIIRIGVEEGALGSDQINAVYEAESQLMGLGVIEETPESIDIRCSVDPEDFTLDTLLQRLENTGSTMRGEAVKGLTHGNPDLAERALNRERQANKIFVLLLRLIFTSYRNPSHVRAVGLDSGFPLIGYRSVAKNLELTADNAEDIGDIVIEMDGKSLDVDKATMRRIREIADQVDRLTALAVDSIVERDYDLTVECRELSEEISDRETAILADLPEKDNAELLRIREVLVSLQQTTQYAIRNAEIAANLALNRENNHVDLL